MLKNNIVWNSTPTGWTTDEAACWYVDAMLHPYWRRTREQLAREDAALADVHGINVCDVYKSHFAPSVMAKLRAANAATAFVPANETDRKQVCDVAGGVFGWLKPCYVRHMKKIENDRLKAWLADASDDEERKPEEFGEKVWCCRSQMQQRIDLLVALDRAVTDFNNERGGSIAAAWDTTGQRDLFKVYRLLKALPQRERLLKGVKAQVQRHRSKQAAQVDQVVDRTVLAAGGVQRTLPVTPAGTHGRGRWRPVIEVADDGGLKVGMIVFATADFFDYEGNKLPVNNREGKVTAMHNQGPAEVPLHQVA